MANKPTRRTAQGRKELNSALREAIAALGAGDALDAKRRADAILALAKAREALEVPDPGRPAPIDDAMPALALVHPGKSRPDDPLLCALNARLASLLDGQRSQLDAASVAPGRADPADDLGDLGA